VYLFFDGELDKENCDPRLPFKEKERLDNFKKFVFTDNFVENISYREQHHIFILSNVITECMALSLS
jgi:hypothetical protein